MQRRSWHGLKVHLQELRRKCLAAALALALPTGCRDRERWPRSERVRTDARVRETDCRSLEKCPVLAGPCPSTGPVASAGVPAIGRLDEARTAQVRGRFPYEPGSTQPCCYSWTEGCHGRPLLGENGTALRSAAVERGDWFWELGLSLNAGQHADEVADGWLELGRDEHASIGGFLRTSMVLLALGAPSELVTAQLKAAEDEANHACVAFGIARHFGSTRGPGALDLESLPKLVTADELALDTLLGGCIGETLAAAVAFEAASRAAPELRPWLEHVAEDEGHHALLAWRTLGWLLPGLLHPERLEKPLRTALALLNNRAFCKRKHSLEPFGLLDARTTKKITETALRTIVSPCLEVFFGESMALSADGLEAAQPEKRSRSERRRQG